MAKGVVLKDMFYCIIFMGDLKIKVIPHKTTINGDDFKIMGCKLEGLLYM